MGGLAPANNFTVARAYRDLPNSSQIGAIFVNRQATGALAGSDDYNRAYGVDGRVGIGPNGQIAGFAALTDTPGLAGDDHAYNVAWDHNSERWRFTLGYVEVADNFNPEVGFLRRQGFRNLDSGFSFITRPRGIPWLQQVRPHATFNRFWNFAGFQETSFLHIDNDLEFADSTLVKTAWNVHGRGRDPNRSRSRRASSCRPASTTTTRRNIAYESNRGAPVSVGARARIGGSSAATGPRWDRL